MSVRDFIIKLQNLPESRKKIVLWTIVIVLGLIMGFFWIAGTLDSLQKFSQSGQPILPQVEMPAIEMPVAEIPTDETAGWKTYKNDQLGYSFEYPQELTSFTGVENKTDDYVFGACDSQHNFCIYTNIIKINQASFNDYIDVFKSVNSKSIIKINPGTILGKKAVIIEEDTGSEKGIFTFIDFGYPMAVSLTTGGEYITDAETNYADIEAINDKIISTFKFTK